MRGATGAIAGGVLVAACGLRAARADEAGPTRPAGAGLAVAVEAFVGSPTTARTRVREYALVGDRLELRRALGIDTVEEVGVSVGWPLGTRTTVVGAISRIVLWGATDLPLDRQHNLTTYQAGTRLESRPDWTVAELRVRRRLFAWGAAEAGTLALDLGLRLDYLDWKFNGTVAPGSLGRETGEGFYKQATPIPVVGLAWRQALGPGVALDASVRGGWARRWNSQRQEGGVVYFSETLLDARLALAVGLWDGGVLTVGARAWYLTLAEQSHEDGNHLRLPAVGGTLGLEIRF